MAENQFINFLGVPNLELNNSVPSAEWIEYRNNILRTIKEYREYSDPMADGWVDYILELFHLLGLQTIHIGPRLIKLSSFDGGHNEDAIALILNQKDNQYEAISGLTWSSHLFYVCKYFNIKHGFISNGKTTKLYHWGEEDFHDNYILADLDSMILTDSREVFGLWLTTIAKITGRSVSYTPTKNKKNSTPKSQENSNKENLRYGIVVNLFQQLFSELQDSMLSRRPDLGNPRKVLPQTWWGFGAGKSGLAFNYCFIKPLVLRVEVYIDAGDYDKNKYYFDMVYSSREEIEREIGFPLDWERLEHRRACRIAAGMPFDFNADETERARLHEWAVSTMIKFYDVFRPRILRLPH
jgi:hypothetical protein